MGRIANFFRSLKVLSCIGAKLELYDQGMENIRNNNALLDGLLKQVLQMRYIMECEQNCSLDEWKSKRETEKALCDLFYLHYNEKLMPDSREDVKSRESVYMDKVIAWGTGRTECLDTLRIVDLGCGECEWVELLNANGFSAVGIDGNHAVVEKVRRELPDIEILEEDAIQFLRHCENESIDCISSFHMVEHMDFMTIVSLLRECHRVLKQGGMIIIETPNPQNILTATYYFNMDPTHIKPIPPELMKFFLEESGFLIEHSLLLNPLDFEPYEYNEDDPIKDIIFRFNMEQAYSYMAIKK